MTQICLNMIVKNEAARIERCLASVVPHVHSWVIVDTGSSDGTQAMIRDFMGARDLPGRLEEAPFTNFRDTRNVALEYARRLRGDLGWDYLLLTDADMELVAPDGLGALTAPGYQLLQKNGGLQYFNARLVHHDNKCEYCCPTHEYLSTAQPLEKLHGAWFIDWADGSNRLGKVERDIALLEAELKVNPEDQRCWFYLGNSYREIGRYAEAVDAYEKRVALGGWQEEVYVSLLYAARAARAMQT